MHQPCAHSKHPFLTTLILALPATMFAAPAIAGTIVIDLKDPRNEVPGYDQVQIKNQDGTFGIPKAGFGGRIDKGFISIPKMSDSEIRSEFGPAIDAMDEILKQGLPGLQHSYMVLPDSASGALVFESGQGAHILSTPGQAMMIDGYSYNPYPVDKKAFDTDFGPLMQTVSETKAAGQPVLSYVVLLANPDGTVGKILVNGGSGAQLISKQDQAMELDRGSNRIFQADTTQIKADFGEASAALPPLPTHTILFFDSGTTLLTADSQNILAGLIANIKGRPFPELTVSGYTDTVSSRSYNQKLSLKRAQMIAEDIEKQTGLAPDHVEINAYGETHLLVPTKDSTPEPKNRRVEVDIR